MLNNKVFTQEKRIAAIARRQVATALREILSDPDVGLSLRRKAMLRLRKSLHSKKEGRLKNLTEVLKKYRF